MDRRPSRCVPATAEHIDFVAARVRREHARETAELCRTTVDAALRASFAASAACYAVVPEGEPILVAGVEPARPLLPGSAVVWMMGTKAMDRHPVLVLRAARWGVGEAYRVTGAERLEQWIPEWYGTGLRFAVDGLGFEVRGTFPGTAAVHVVHEKAFFLPLRTPGVFPKRRWRIMTKGRLLSGEKA